MLTQSRHALLAAAWVALSVLPVSASFEPAAGCARRGQLSAGLGSCAGWGSAQGLRLRGGKPINGKKPKPKGGAAKALAKSQTKAKDVGGKSDGGKKVGTGGAGAGALDLSDLKSSVAELDEGLPTVTGNLMTHEGSQDIKIGSFSLEVYSKVLIEDTTLELNKGRRYGLLGMNGSGKSTLLRALAGGLLPIPPHIDIFMLSQAPAPALSVTRTDLSLSLSLSLSSEPSPPPLQECAPSNMTALETVVQGARDETARLEVRPGPPVPRASP
jgi:hypothetical protein